MLVIIHVDMRMVRVLDVTERKNLRTYEYIRVASPSKEHHQQSPSLSGLEEIQNIALFSTTMFSVIKDHLRLVICSHHKHVTLEIAIFSVIQ